MTGSLIAAVTLATLVGAQSPAPPAPVEPKVNDAAETTARRVTGCVSRETADGPFTLGNGTYELTGASVAPYVGKRVELKGKSHRLRVSGGLYPSANIAAQAGAIDPLQTTFAAVSGQPTRDTLPPREPTFEFRVEKVRPIKGTCP